MGRTLLLLPILLMARPAFAAQPTVLWLDGISGKRAAALRGAFLTADTVSAKQIAAANSDAARHHARLSDALRVKLAHLANNSEVAVIYIHSQGRDGALIAVHDTTGFRTTTLRLSAHPTRSQLIAFVTYASSKVAAPASAPTPEAVAAVAPAPVPSPPEPVDAVVPVLASPPPQLVVTPPARPPPAVEAAVAETPAAQGSPWQSKMFDFALGGGTISRRLTLQKIATGNMASYSLNAAGALSGRGAIAPMLFSGVPVLRDWQIYGEMGGAPGFASANPNTGGISTTHWWFWRAGMAMRFRVGDGLPIFTADVSAAGESFNFSSSGVLVSQVPSVGYVMGRFGGQVEEPLGQHFKLGVVGAFRWVPSGSGGYLATRFAGTRIIGFDVGGEISAKLGGGFYAQLAGGYVRYDYSLHPKQTDPYVAAGAIDELPYGEVRLGFQL